MSTSYKRPSPFSIFCIYEEADGKWAELLFNYKGVELIVR